MRIFRQFDLASEYEIVDELFDNPRLMPIELRPSCSETGYTTLLFHAQEVDEAVKRRWKRRFRRFPLYNGVSEELNQLMEDENVRILNRYDHFTENGAIIILDYEFKSEE